MNFRAAIEALETKLANAFSLANTALSTAEGVSRDGQAQTVDAATASVDTGYVVPANTGVRIDGGFVVKDVANKRVNGKHIAASIGQFASDPPAVHGTPIVSGGSGDAQLNAATMSLSFSLTNTLVVTLTPPGGYVGTLDWVFGLDFDED